MKKIHRKIHDFSLTHRVSSFILTICLTILITRLTVLIKDFNPIIKGYELHHFHYGVALLILTVILILFGKKHPVIYPTLAGISIGLIADEFLYILGMMTSLEQYHQTLTSAIFFSIAIIIIVEIIYFTNKHEQA